MNLAITHGKRTNTRDNFLQKWFGLFAPEQTRQPPTQHDTNIDPCLCGSSTERYPSKPKVAFGNKFHPDGLNKKKDGYWNNLSPGQGVAGYHWVAFVPSLVWRYRNRRRSVPGMWQVAITWWEQVGILRHPFHDWKLRNLLWSLHYAQLKDLPRVHRPRIPWRPLRLQDIMPYTR